MAEIEAWQPAIRADRPVAAPARTKPWLFLGGALGLSVAGVVLTYTALLSPGSGPPRHEAGPTLTERNNPPPIERRDEPAVSDAPTDREPPPPERPQPPPQIAKPSDPGEAMSGPSKEGVTSPEPNRPTAEPKSEPPSQLAVADSPKVEPPPGTTGMEQVAAYIRGYRGGSCFFLNPMTVGAQEATVEAYGVDPQPFQAFDTAFRKTLGFEAQIQLRQVEPGQCAVVDLLAAQAQAKPASVPLMKLEGDRIRSGEMLRGELELSASRNVKLLLVEGDGTLHDLSSHLERSGQLAKFAIRIERPASDGWRPQLLLAVTSPKPLSIAGNGSRANYVFPSLARDAADPASTLGLTVRYLKAGG